MFKSKHLFVELHQFLGEHWRETHRWNHGLEEELVHVEADPEPQHNSWTAPHLPSVSLLGLAALEAAVGPQFVLLDASAAGARALDRVAEALVQQSVEMGWLAAERAAEVRQRLCERLGKPKTAAHAAVHPTSPPRHSDDGVSVGTGSVGSAGSVGLDDPLNRQAQEEIAQVVVDSASWLSIDVVLIARFAAPVVTGLEETVERGRRRDRARFVVLCLSPPSASAPRRHVEVGRTLAALMQDDRMLASLYASTRPHQVVATFEGLLKDMKMMPLSAVPSEQAIMRRAKQMMTKMMEARPVHRGALTQHQNWLLRQQSPFKKGLSVSAVTKAMQKFAVPLLAGIALSLALANADEHGFDHWAGYGPGVGHHGGPVLDRPDAFGLEVNHHAVTIHFVVNDVFMCLFFGLAAKEITEALQPGGSLYPPTRTTVNVLAATLGGVLGPIAVYVALVSSLHAAGVLDQEYSLAEYAIGWGVPTATDISLAWMTALCVFGAGHPAINYLLLLAIIDDAIGLMIIAFAYPDPHHPVQPVYLLLVVAASLVAFALRRLRCARWQIYLLLCGPLAWCGLLYASLHPSLALVFVVPFIPMHVEDDIIAFALESGGADGKHSHGHRHAFGIGTFPLHDFEEAIKDFVDFIVLFAFGLVNAGVQVDSVGWLTVIVLVSLVAGKTLGISVASSLGSCAGCPPPAGMTRATVAGVGFIASAGLTVALFVSGEAFEDTPVLMAQAKMGALLSVAVAFVAVGASYLQAVLPSCSGGAGRGDAGSASARVDSGPPPLERVLSTDEKLEDIVVNTAVRNIKLAHTTHDAIVCRSNSRAKIAEESSEMMEV